MKKSRKRKDMGKSANVNGKNSSGKALIHGGSGARLWVNGWLSRAERNQTKGRSKTLPPRPSG